ncbi:hypothetical protein EVAR_30421_1 [Eumeta japonica]|uniref:Uncharacterized protein n=1 Tax=Eumeta variegata TaxID=151549 RepID=A0A4C1W5U6_EUMVA|nr:hypothetical protein EVAR_30421_1 [Eumeta japonica]
MGHGTQAVMGHQVVPRGTRACVVVKRSPARRRRSKATVGGVGDGTFCVSKKRSCPGRRTAVFSGPRPTKSRMAL